MDDVVKSLIPSPKIEPIRPLERPSRQEAEDAVRTLLRWAGDDPGARGLARDAGPRGQGL